MTERFKFLTLVDDEEVQLIYPKEGRLEVIKFSDRRLIDDERINEVLELIEGASISVNDLVINRSDASSLLPQIYKLFDDLKVLSRAWVFERAEGSGARIWNGCDVKFCLEDSLCTWVINAAFDLVTFNSTDLHKDNRLVDSIMSGFRNVEGAGLPVLEMQRALDSPKAQKRRLLSLRGVNLARLKEADAAFPDQAALLAYLKRLTPWDVVSSPGFIGVHFEGFERDITVPFGFS